MRKIWFISIAGANHFTLHETTEELFNEWIYETWDYDDLLEIYCFTDKTSECVTMSRYLKQFDKYKSIV
jgi:hypothetical protein